MKKISQDSPKPGHRIHDQTVDYVLLMAGATNVQARTFEVSDHHKFGDALANWKNRFQSQIQYEVNISW